MLFYCFYYFCCFVNNLLISEANDTKSKLFHFFRPVGIVFYLVICEMIGTIHLYNQLLLQTHKIRDKVVDDVLPLEFQTKFTSTQALP